MQRRTLTWGTPGSRLGIRVVMQGCTTTGTSDASGRQIDACNIAVAGVGSLLAGSCTTAKSPRVTRLKSL